MTCIHGMYSLIAVVVQINWTVSRLSVTEGDAVKLYGEVFGSYANPIEIGVVCAETDATGNEPGMNMHHSRHYCRESQY